MSGCLTLTLQPRNARRPRSKVLVVYGSGAGEFPADALRYLPDDMYARLEFISQRHIVHAHPLSAGDMRAAETYAAHLLAYYKRHAALVITPLHHAATPCIAAGIPVVLCRAADSSRFSYLRELLPVYLPPDFRDIDWQRRSCSRRDEHGLVRQALEQATGERLSACLVQ